MIKHFFLKMWTVRAHIDQRSALVAIGSGYFLGVFLGFALIGWLTGGPDVSPAPQPVPQTAPQVKSVEAEKELMTHFLSGLEDLERTLDEWVDAHGDQLERRENAWPSEEDAVKFMPWSDQSVWFLSDKAYPKLEPSVARLLGCRVDDPASQSPSCRGNVYSFYDVQCDGGTCSWTLCRHNETPYSCTYSLNGYRGKFGRWENNCNIILPQSRAWCEYLRDEKGFIVHDIS